MAFPKFGAEAILVILAFFITSAGVGAVAGPSAWFMFNVNLSNATNNQNATVTSGTYTIGTDAPLNHNGSIQLNDGSGLSVAPPIDSYVYGYTSGQRYLVSFWVKNPGAMTNPWYIAPFYERQNCAGKAYYVFVQSLGAVKEIDAQYLSTSRHLYYLYPTDNAWHHIAYGVDPGTKNYTLFLDGILVNMSVYVAASDFCQGETSRNSFMGSNGWIGTTTNATKLADYRVWANAPPINESLIQSIMNDGAIPATISFGFPLNNNSGHDLSGDFINWTTVISSTGTLDRCWFTSNINGAYANLSNSSCSSPTSFSVAAQLNANSPATVCGYFGANTTTGVVATSFNSCFNWEHGTLQIWAIDESSMSLIAGQEILVRISNDNYAVNTSMQQGNVSVALPIGVYFVDVGNTNYPSRRFSATIAANITTQLYAYLAANTSSAHYLTLTVKNLANELISGANVQVMKQSGASFLTVENVVTDIFGTARVFVDSLVEYKFVVSASGYVTAEDTFFPVDTTRTIYLNSASQVPETIWSNIFYSINASDCANFTFTTNSPAGAISSFGVLVVPNASISYSNIVSNSNSGGIASLSLNLSNFTNHPINSYYFIESPGLETLNVSRTCYVSGSATPGSVQNVVINQILPQMSSSSKLILTSILAIGAALIVSEFIGGMGPAMAGALVIVAAGIFGLISQILSGIIVLLMFLVYFAFGRGGE